MESRKYNLLEKKFVAVRKEHVSTYITSNGYVGYDEYNIEQKHVRINGITDGKFRKIINGTKTEYKKYLYGDKCVDVIDITEDEYNKVSSDTETINKNRKVYNHPSGNYKLCVDTFTTPVEFTMMEVEASYEHYPTIPIPVKGFVNVTTNGRYENKNIAKNSLRTGCTLDGGDLAGKTTVLTELVHDGYVCQDRDVVNICPFMYDHIAEQDRVAGLTETITNTKDIIIFLVNTDEDEIHRRSTNRESTEGLSEFDDDAVLYNMMYFKSGKTLETKKFKNFTLIDGKGRTVSEVKDMILKAINTDMEI